MFIHFGCSNNRMPYIRDSEGLQSFQVQQHFSTCACVYKQEKHIPFSLISLNIPYRYKLSCPKTFEIQHTYT